MSQVPVEVATSRAETGVAPARWERAEEVASYRQQGKRFVSRGHFAGRWQVQISVNETAERVYASLAPSSRFAEGSVLVKAHFDAQSGAAGPIFARIKREKGFFPEGDDWEYVVTDASFLIEDRGSLALCARCHAEAMADDTFALSRDAR